jgi:hypothetical protein
MNPFEKPIRIGMAGSGPGAGIAAAHGAKRASARQVCSGSTVKMIIIF